MGNLKSLPFLVYSTIVSAFCGMISTFYLYVKKAYLVGSSKNITGGLFTSSKAMARRLR